MDVKILIYNYRHQIGKNDEISNRRTTGRRPYDEPACFFVEISTQIGEISRKG